MDEDKVEEIVDKNVFFSILEPVDNVQNQIKKWNLVCSTLSLTQDYV